MALAHFLSAFAVIGLAGCGSGGGGGAPAAPPSGSPPVITLGPGGQAAAAGATVSFDVSALGGPTRYQWRRNGVDIGGATAATYTLVVAQGDDGARFSVVVGNDVGAVTSGDAALTVFAVPPSLATCTGGNVGLFALTSSAAGKVGVDVGAVAGGCTAPLRSAAWTQTGGPAVTLRSDKTNAISFAPPAAGTYTFRVDVVDMNGATDTRTVSIPVLVNADAAQIAVRADQAASQGGNVSLRAWTIVPPGDAVASITWQQTAGPAVVLDTRDPLRVLFTAPTVAADTVLSFAATLRTRAGLVATDDAFVVVESRAQAPAASGSHVFAGTHVSRVYAYKPAGRYAGVLQRCVYDPQLQDQGAGKNTCSLATLPFLAQDTGGAEPSVAQIMEHVVVSHDWMGANFERFIARADMADVRRLLNGVTAIVIGAHVRPSFYYAVTGAIYLDADNFWLGPEERDVIDETPDFRSGFDRDLAYSGLWRYVQNGQNIFFFFPLDLRLNRASDYLVNEAAWLLYHELGHANDFLPPASVASLDTARTAWDNIAPRVGGAQLPSDALARQFPLASNELRDLAQVKFFGATATPPQRAYTPRQVADFFRPDRASDEYGYTNTREDFALLFEEFMMARNHAIRRDFAITDKILPTTTGNSLVVRWGQRGRAGLAPLKPRVKLAVDNVAPWIGAAAVDALAAPLDMRAGDSWNANLSLPAPAGGTAVRDLSRPATQAADAYQLERAQRRR